MLLTESQHEVCAAYYGAFQELAPRVTGHLATFERAIGTLRAAAPDLPAILFYTWIGDRGMDLKVEQRLAAWRSKFTPFDVVHMGSIASWLQRLSLPKWAQSKEAQDGLTRAFRRYPHPFKTVGLHLAAKTCKQVIYLDSDVVVFRDPRLLLKALDQNAADLAAPPETCTDQWNYATLRLGWNMREDLKFCLENQPVTEGGLNRVYHMVCKQRQDAAEKMIPFQASVMVMGSRLLQLVAKEEFLEEYLALCVRLLDTSRNIAAFDGRNLSEDLPRTFEAIPFPSPSNSDGRPVFITEQVAAYVLFACAGIRLNLLPLQMVVAGFPADFLLHNCSLTPVAFHLTTSAFAEVLQWYRKWRRRCVGDGNRTSGGVTSISIDATGSADALASDIMYDIR